MVRGRKTGPRSQRFWRAALQRHAAAESLLHSEGYRLEAMYLAGYAVECAMKALILARVPKRDQSSFAKEFRGAKYHRFAFLKERLARLGCSMPAPVSEGMRPITTWSTELRYDVGLKSYEDAKRFIDAANCICEGVKRSM